jgi:hypothetical protein
VRERRNHYIARQKSRFNDIDYEKLGEAIAKAIIKEEKTEREKYSLTREWMKSILYPAFIAFSVAAGGVCLYSFYKLYVLLVSLNNSNYFIGFLKGFFQITCFFGLGLFSLFICLTTFWSYKEIEKENDRQFVAMVLSIITALAALIVALAALFQGAFI